jgi:hypothetical protein
MKTIREYGSKARSYWLLVHTCLSYQLLSIHTAIHTLSLYVQSALYVPTVLYLYTVVLPVGKEFLRDQGATGTGQKDSIDN